MAQTTPDAARLPFTVGGMFKNGKRTFYCPTAKWALRKLAEFEHARYRDITITGPNGMVLTEADLKALLVPVTIYPLAPADADL